MPHAPFVPLRIFSAYTMLEGALDPKDIVKLAKRHGFPAAALTDRNGLYAAMAFSEAAMKEGVQPIIGAMLGVARPPRGDAPPALDWLALYAQDEAGYRNLCELVSAAHLDRPIEQDPHVSFESLSGKTDGLICLTAGAEGALARLFAEEQAAEAIDYVDRLERLFPNRLYIELSRRMNEVEARAEKHLIDLAYAHDLPLVATNPCCFGDEHFHAAHDAMLCIADSAYLDSDDRRKSSADAWLKPLGEMQKLFEDLPEAIANTLVVAQRCAVAAPKRKPILPSLAGDREGEAAKLREDARAGLVERLRKIEELSAPGFGETDPERLKAKYPDYFARLEFELDVIIQMGFPGYFLIVADFIKWAKANDIPVGPGRGSGAGSVVAWALTITDLDPIKLGLLFERFLNPERVSMPDFDIDFCETHRDKVIRYVQQRYGRDTVAQIITFGRLKARAVLKDTGRVLQMSYGQVDRLAKLVPNHPTDPWTLERALNGVSELAAEYKNDREVKRLFDLAMKLEGFPRHSSTHAAGVVIGDRPLAELIPLYRDPRSDMPVTQFDMKYVEGAGLVKFDFLGLKTLSVLKKAVQMLAKRGVSIDLDALSWDDEAVYQLLQRGDTVGVFQLESEGMRRTLAAVKPTNFGDIIALVSLYRPGPMDNIPLFGDRKNGRARVEYPHPLLETILAETYGIFVYQEQVMQAAQVLAGYSLGGADLLRRAMGKKIKAEMDAQRAIFVEGCAKVNNIPADKANELFDLIDKFAGYGFNKSHAAAYALLAYQTAWLKAHHPHEFYAASMCYDMAQTDKLGVFVDDMRRLDVAMLPPDVNASEAEFAVETAGEGLAVRYALGALKNVGERAMELLVEERRTGGAFKSLDDFANRVDPKLLNRRQMESLAGAGAFDAIEPMRAGVFAVAETMLAIAAQAENQRSSGQGGLFGMDEASVAAIKLPQNAHWSLAERMTQEKEAFGFYFSAHPIDRYRHLADAHGAKSYGAMCGANIGEERVPGTMAGLVEDVRWRTSAKGRRYLLATCSDASGQFVASCFDEAAAKDLEEAARTGGCGLLSVELDKRAGEETPRVTIRAIRPFETLTANTRLVLQVELDGPGAIAGLRALAEPSRGGRGELRLVAKTQAGEVDLRLGRDFHLDAELAARIERLPGVLGVSLKAAELPKLALVS
ncbi:DNA polymerase III subunit alpha [Sphingomonas sp. MAH-20]|uniref:DNA polymerase III subunit alpha n=1 Tax=Sphingomonas horti TaxID=2682842 RepID=A0A6I4IYB9_9SPHN|nr:MULTISPECIES: DNA polymerase III subunit alpha [Sphingomonas]MBA2918115.1 DNA polymerase III subunit alpha [Sphingomonas sp. CGMCC 1.13658]MVO77086.1 DNA polymerase III subunit alpha [Sphingomonas horti]